MSKRIVLLLITSLTLLCSVTAKTIRNTYSNKIMLDQSSYFSIGHSLFYYEDPSKNLSFQEIQSAEFKTPEYEVPNFGYEDADYWFRFNVAYPAGTIGEKYILQIAKPTIDTITVFFVVNGQVIEKGISGDLVQNDEKKRKHHTFLFEVPRANQSVEVFIHCEGNNSKQFPINLLPESALNRIIQKENLINGLIFGIFLAMLLYNLLLFIGIGGRSFLFYVIFLFAFLMAELSLTGYAQQYLFQHVPRFGNISNQLFIGITILSAAFFSRRFLKTRETIPRLHKLIFAADAMSVPLILIAVIAMMYDPWTLVASQWAAFAGGISAVIFLVIAIAANYRGYRPAKFYLLAWSFFYVAVIIYVFKNNALIAQNFFTDNSLQLGFITQTLLLSLGLADRIKTTEKEKQKAQKQVIETLQENEKLILSQNEMLERRVEERTREIQEKNTELETQKEEIATQRDKLEETTEELEKKNRNITASITYARRIQEAMLPREEKFESVFKEHFVFFRPRDIVSGDFYWLEESDEYVAVAAVDCTGHGVPGAIMSMIGYNLLNDAWHNFQYRRPADILLHLHLGVRQILKQDDSENRDGMDMGLVVFEKKSGNLVFSGAKNPLLYFDGQRIQQIKGDVHPIGGHDREHTIFKEHTLEAKNIDTIYLLSDGFQDQFGGPDRRKFMSKRLRELVEELNISGKKSEGIKAALGQQFDQWKGTEKQTDDVLILGLRFP